MAKPLPPSTTHRNGVNGPPLRSPVSGAVQELEQPAADPHEPGGELPPAGPEDLELLRAENEQLRALCTELEQALQEATQQAEPNSDERLRELETLLEEKTDTIRQLHEQLREAKAAAGGEDDGKPAAPAGPLPREDELLALSEELERERRQLQEDEQALMEQMREMEVSMARERAEMARQRNDLQRIQSEVRHELERLERSGALQTKIDGLKSRLQDATTRRGLAQSAPGAPAPPLPAVPPAAAEPPKKDGGLIGRLFGGGR